MNPIEWTELDRKSLESFLRSQCGRRFMAKMRYLQAQTAVAGCSPRQEATHYTHLAGTAFGIGESIEAILELARKQVAAPVEELAEV